LSGIYIEDVEGRVAKQVSTDIQNLALPTWSADCQWLFASDGHEDLYRMPSQGGNATLISNKVSWFSLVRKGSVFFDVIDGTRFAIWSEPVDGGEAAPLKGMPELSGDESWTATEHGIYYTSSGVTASTLNYYDFATRTVRHLCAFPQLPTPGGGIAVSPDGHWLLFTHTDDAQSDIMIARHFQ
jgi:Tol biopolymer transport system component